MRTSALLAALVQFPFCGENVEAAFEFAVDGGEVDLGNGTTVIDIGRRHRDLFDQSRGRIRPDMGLEAMHRGACA